MTQGPGERLPSYAWPPLPVLDPDEAAELLAERLGWVYGDLEARRLAVIESLFEQAGRAAAARLAEFLLAIGEFRSASDYHVRKFLQLHLGPAYEAGVLEALPAGTPMSWTTAHRQALTSLATDTYGDFLRRSQQAQRVSAEFARTVRQAAARELPAIAAGGTTAVQAGDALAERLTVQFNVTEVTYRDGSRVPVRQYARMAARTKSAVAYNAGTLNSLHEQGVGYVEVFDGDGCGWTTHGDADRAAGSVRTVRAAAEFPVSHPNCRRAFGGRPDVVSAKDAREARPVERTNLP